MERTRKSSSIKLLTRLRIIKNLIVISLSFVLLFTAYNGLSMLQSTMNKHHGIGTVSQAVVYISFGISSLLFPDFIIKSLGCKTSLVVASIMYLPYVAANFSPDWFVMMPSAALLGFGASILWGAQCTYFSESSFLFCTLDSDDNTQLDSSTPESTNTSCDRLSSNASSLHGSDNGDKLPNKGKIEELNVKSLKPDDKSPVKDKEVANKLPESTNTSCDRLSSNASSLHGSDNGDKLPNKGKIEEPNVKSLKPDDESPAKDEKVSTLVSDPDNRQENKNRTTPEKGRNVVTFGSDAAAPKLEEESQCREKSNRYTSSRQTAKDSITSEAIEFYSLLGSANALFFGCHGLAYYSAQIWSNLMSYFILHPHSTHNETRIYTCSCGPNFCNDEHHCINDDSGKMSHEARYILTGVCLGLGVLGAFFIMTFLDSLERCQKNRSVKFSLKHALATFNICRKKEQLFLVPLTLYVGMAQGFYTADITKSYIDCAWGTSHVGLVTVFYGLACALSSTISGCLVQFTGRKPIFLIGQVVNMINYAFLLTWTPELHHPFMFYLAASMWGIITGLFWSQLQAFYGVLFQKDVEAAFGSYNLYSALGWTLSFVYSNYICTWIKIYVLAAVSCLGILGYLYSERLHHLKRKPRSMTR